MALSKKAQGDHQCVLLQKLMDHRVSVSITGILLINSLSEKHGLCPISSLILALSHKSGALCLYEPLPVSDALGDDYFEIFDVFLVETFFFYSKLITLYGPTAAKKTVAPKKAIFRSLSGENNSTKKKKKKKKLSLLSLDARKSQAFWKAIASYFTTLSNVPAICRTLTPVCSTLK